MKIIWSYVEIFVGYFVSFIKVKGWKVFLNVVLKCKAYVGWILVIIEVIKGIF